MITIFKGSSSRGKGTTTPFADFIRNAKSDEKKRVYSAVLTEATQRQNETLAAAGRAARA